MSRFFGRVLVGILVSVPVVGSLFQDGWGGIGGGSGSDLNGVIANGATFMLLSIVCTAGIGLVFWIPIWWVVGEATLAVLNRFFRKVEYKTLGPDPPVAVPTNPTNTESRINLALTAYIRKATATGVDRDEMRRRLQLNGWNRREIESAIERALTEYIRKRTAKGMGEDEITRSLQRNGWGSEEIQNALQSVNAAQSSAKQ